MLVTEKTIQRIDEYGYFVLAILLEYGEMTTNEMVDCLFSDRFEYIINDRSKSKLERAISQFRDDGVIYNGHCYVMHRKLSDVSHSQQMIELINACGGFGLTRREHAVLNHADLFLNNFSSDNKIHPGKGGDFHKTIGQKIDSVRFVNINGVTTEWMERYTTMHKWYNYKLNDNLFRIVKNWREITRLYKQFQI